MDYDQAVAYLDRHIGLGWRPGLERIGRLVELMGSPHLQYPVLHVAGTNGKTTVTLAAASILNAMGLKAGTYTSPHLRRVEERFSAAGETASPEQFAQAVEDTAPFVDLLEAETGERPTYFELTTAAAFAFFAAEAVDVGGGGGGDGRAPGRHQRGGEPGGGADRGFLSTTPSIWGRRSGRSPSKSWPSWGRAEHW